MFLDEINISVSSLSKAGSQPWYPSERQYWGLEQNKKAEEGGIHPFLLACLNGDPVFSGLQILTGTYTPSSPVSAHCSQQTAGLLSLHYRLNQCLTCWESLTWKCLELELFQIMYLFSALNSCINRMAYLRDGTHAETQNSFIFHLCFIHTA